MIDRVNLWNYCFELKNPLSIGYPLPLIEVVRLEQIMLQKREENYPFQRHRYSGEGQLVKYTSKQTFN